MEVHDPGMGDLLFVEFSEYLRMPYNISLWNNTNEGQDRIRVIYEPNYETQTLLEEQEIE